jgi:hypothetical protein
MLYKLLTQPSKQIPGVGPSGVDTKELITIYINTNEVCVIAFGDKDYAAVYLKDATGMREPYVVTHKEANDLIKYTNGLGHYN